MRSVMFMIHRGGTTGWTGGDVSTPLFSKIDFVIRLNSMRKWGGGVISHFPFLLRDLQAAFLFFLIEEISISTRWLGVNSPNPSRK